MHTTAYAPLSSPTTMGTMKRQVPNLLKVCCACLPASRGLILLRTCLSHPSAWRLLGWGLSYMACCARTEMPLGRTS